MKINKKHILCMIVGAVCLATILSFTAITGKDNLLNNDGYKLIFSDEFNLPDGSQPDSTKWKRCRRNPSRWARWISDSKDVVYIKNGKLVCRAIPNKDLKADTAQMLTGAIETMGVFEMKYGKVEVRMRTNAKIGNSPAAWIRNDQRRYKLYSEIDIMESFGKKKEVFHTIHSEYTVNNPKHGEKNLFKSKTNVTKWHIYGIIWTPTEVIWTIDGKETGRYHKSSSSTLLAKHQWTFNQPMFLRLNQSLVYGSVEQNLDTKTTFVTEFDWIRVYQKR